MIALSINNWNDAKKKNQLEAQLIDVLIADLQLKNQECISDLAYGKSMIQKSDITIEYRESDGKIDTTNLKYLLRSLGSDDSFYDKKSPIYVTLASSALCKHLLDSLISQIDEVYRLRHGGVKRAFVKSTEYATNCKLHFLSSNHLIALHKSNAETDQILSEKM